MVRGAQITAWQPPIPGLREVLHAHFPDHAYPMHTHDSWTLLLVDEGVVRYDLDRHEHGAMRSLVTLLPPNVPHDGRSVRPEGFRKRVLYLDADLLGGSTGNHLDGGDPGAGDLGADLTGVAVDNPGLTDPLLRMRIHQLHEVLASRTEDLEAQSRLLFIRERLNEHLLRARTAPTTQTRQPDPTHRLNPTQQPGPTLQSGPTHQPASNHQPASSRQPASTARPTSTPTTSTAQPTSTGQPTSTRRTRLPSSTGPARSASRRDPGIAGQLRELLDARVQPGITLDEAARLLHSHPTHLVRAFSREYDMPPHLYLTGRRVELARRHLLAGLPTAEVAVLAGFYDQSHLTRHFRRMLGVSPGRYARTGPGTSSAAP